MEKTTRIVISNLKKEQEENRVWCCAWGLIKPEPIFTSLENEDSSLAKLKPKEFVIIGGIKPQMKIVHISSSKENVFPYEYSYQLPGMGVHHVALNSDSNCISAVSIDGNLMLLDIKGGVRLPNISYNHNRNFWSTTFGCNNESVLGGTGSGYIYKYDTIVGKLQHRYDTHCCENVLGLAISADQGLVGATDYAGNFTLLDGITGQILCSKNFKKPMRKLVFDPSMRHALSACDDKTIKVIDLPSGRLRDTLTSHDALVMSVAISPDGLRFVSGACDGSIKLWDARTTKCPLSFVCSTNSNLWDVAFNKLSTKISSVGDGKGLNVYYCLGNREIMLV